MRLTSDECVESSPPSLQKNRVGTADGPRTNPPHDDTPPISKAAGSASVGMSTACLLRVNALKESSSILVVNLIVRLEALRSRPPRVCRRLRQALR